MSIRKAIVAVTALAVLAPAAMAQGAPKNILNNGWQVNWAVVASKNSLWGGWVGGDVRGQSTAIGNNFEATVEGDSQFFNQQMQLSPISAETHISLTKGVGGNVELQTTAVCNNASFTANNGYSYTYNDQRCGTIDPTAFSNVSFGMVLGDTTIGATAIANNLSIGGNGDQVVLAQDRQVNTAHTFARVDAQVGSTNGKFEVNAQAVGNNISVYSGN